VATVGATAMVTIMVAATGDRMEHLQSVARFSAALSPRRMRMATAMAPDAPTATFGRKRRLLSGLLTFLLAACGPSREASYALPRDLV